MAGAGAADESPGLESGFRGYRFDVIWPANDCATIGLGCMRLSTERDRDEARAVEVLHAALDLGVTFLDTADAYCLNDSDTGHNERLIARALKTWHGDRSP